MSNRYNTVELLLRVGVAFAFLYPAIAAFFDPFSWIGYFPALLQDLFSNQELLLHSFGVTEIIIALWLLSGKRIFIPSALASAYLLGIVIFNWGAMDIVFRDLSILAMSVSLAILSYPKLDQTKEAL